jgi:hypothetical protein
MEVEGKDPMRGTTLALAATSVAKNSFSQAAWRTYPQKKVSTVGVRDPPLTCSIRDAYGMPQGLESSGDSGLR